MRKPDRGTLMAALGGLAAVVVALGVVFPGSVAGELLGIASRPIMAEIALRLAVPITLAALGGIFAEKSGVINIGLEGLLIISSFTAVLVAWALGGTTSAALWTGFAGGVLASVLLAGLFAVVCIKYEADQIIAGLAVWLVALGFAPFASSVVFGGKNTTSINRFSEWTVPVLHDAFVNSGVGILSYVGHVLLRANPIVYLMFGAVAVSWYVLNHTAFGRWVEASGENPNALDTAGVNVHRVRYASVLVSGLLSGMGGAALSVGHVGSFVGNGTTMIDGKGFIAIATYLFGNYNPLGTFGAAMLFSGLESLQIGIQQFTPYEVPSQLIQVIPYVTVVVVLVLVGRTRIPEAAGEYYESGDDR
ncbi:ABC transporter permease [Halobacterium salinarum]|uniref:ABC transporter permease n=1 Tax=Halobacterium salinarum TaxID=2242 RepID=UPI001F368844|nr:ABC transporter permease [Halobacterium salinarum]MCF2238519.1 ABC transporter permease [Halobacterium salinarum]MDL0127439.1 ABC transporter permease [Halobacterium salinarum]